MTTDAPETTCNLTARIDDRERRDRSMVKKAEAVIVAVMKADEATLPAAVLTARRALVKEWEKEGQQG